MFVLRTSREVPGSMNCSLWKRVTGVYISNIGGDVLLLLAWAKAYVHAFPVVLLERAFLTHITALRGQLAVAKVHKPAGVTKRSSAWAPAGPGTLLPDALSLDFLFLSSSSQSLSNTELALLVSPPPQNSVPFIIWAALLCSHSNLFLYSWSWGTHPFTWNEL